MKTSLFDAIAALNKLKHRRRKGWLLRGIKNPESVAEHAWRSGVIAYMLTPKGYNKDKLLKMGVLHDISEIFGEDYTPIEGISLKEKEKREERAVKRFCALLPKKQADDFWNIWMECEERKTKEAKFVKECEILEMIFQALEYEKAGNFKQDLTEFLMRDTKRISHPALKKYVKEIKKNWPKRALKSFSGSKYKYYY